MGRTALALARAHGRMHEVAVTEKQQMAITPGTSKATILIDNDRVVVTEHRFQKDEATGWHRHEHDYVIVPLMDGKLKIVTQDGENIAEMKKGAPHFREEGVEQH